MSNIIDFLPILRIFPSEMRSRAIKLHSDLKETYGGMIRDIQERMERGDQVPDSLAKTLLLMKEAEQLDDLDLSMMASGFMIGGVETVRLLFYHLGLCKTNTYCVHRRHPSCNGSKR